MDDRSRIELWLLNLIDERNGAALYEGLARLEKDQGRARNFEQLARGERRHAQLWERKLLEAGATVPPEAPSARTRTLLWLARRLGTEAVLPLVMQSEAGDASKYERQGAEAAGLAEEEREHHEVLDGMRLKTESGARGAIVHRERWHKVGRGGSLRAAVFGMNDGLVSNLSLVLGVAGAGAQQDTLLITGFAGLLAGAFSMATGEYVSVASQRDLLARQVELERRELEEFPEEEEQELAELYQQKGLSPELARATARDLLKNPDSALDTLVREELGLDPGDLGSPLGAAGSSFAMFSVGAVLPILPYFVSGGGGAMLASVGISGAVLGGVGGLLGFLAGTSPLKSAARMMALAGAAAGITFALGKLFGATLG